MFTLQTRILLRSNILETLNQAVESFPLVVITAPMGYGKTTTIRDFIAQSKNRSFYIAVPPDQHNEMYLWDLACAQMVGQKSDMGNTLQRMGFPTDFVQLHRTLEHSRQYINNRPTTLIIDDYHFVEPPAIHYFFEAVVRARIEGLRIILLSRTRPKLPLEDMSLKGMATVFDQRLLTFSKEDVQRYFQLYEIQDAEMAENAWESSEGWAAALWLSVRSYLDHGTIAPGNNIEKLISETIFTSYSKEDKRLLLQLSILDNFLPQQATVVTADMSAPRRLRTLHNQNAFLCYDPKTDTYRLHSLFRTYLNKRLKEQQGETPGELHIDTVRLYRRAGEWDIQHGDRLQAMRFLFQAGREADLLRILEVFSMPNGGLEVMFDPEGVVKMVEGISWELRYKCPMGYLSFIYHYMSRVNLERGHALLEKAVAKFTAEKSISEKMQRKIKGEVELLYGVMAFNDLFVMRDHHEKAHILLQGRSSISHARLIWTFGCPHVAFLYLRKPGTYEELIELIEKNLYFYQELAQGCSAGAQNLFRAEYMLETGRLQGVEVELCKAAHKATSRKQLASLISVSFTKARYSLAEGNDEEARGITKALIPMVLADGCPLLMNSLDLCRAYIAATLNMPAEIPEWLKTGELADSQHFYQGANFGYIVYGKSLLASREWVRLEALAEDIPARLGQYKNVFGFIHAHVQHAIATLHLRGQSDALLHMEKAICLARPDGIVQCIAEYGSHVLPLVQHLVDWYPQDTYISLLHKMTKRYTRLSAGPAHSLLAPRESAVLTLAVEGKSNKEIGEVLGITAASVANTLSRVYGKLKVKNRSEAVKKWGELGFGTFSHKSAVYGETDF